MPTDLRLFLPPDALADHRHIFTSFNYRYRAAMASDAEYDIPMKAHRDLSEGEGGSILVRFLLKLLDRLRSWRREP